MPEHLALWALKHFGPRAAAAVEELSRSQPDSPAAAVLERQTRVAVAEGALVGGPFLVLIPVAWCAALLAQAQMVWELAALAGYDPNDEMRAADLLVLQGAYPSTADARAALAQVTAEGGDRGGSRVAMVRRMAYMLGLIGSGGTKPSRLRAAAGWVGVGAVFVIGLVLPLVWVPYMAVWMRKGTLQLGARAQEYYAADASGDLGVTVRAAQGVQVGLAAGFVRLAVMILLPVVVGVIVLVTASWVNALVLFLVSSLVVTVAWVGLRRWRASRRHAASVPAPS